MHQGKEKSIIELQYNFNLKNNSAVGENKKDTNGALQKYEVNGESTHMVIATLGLEKHRG